MRGVRCSRRMPSSASSRVIARRTEVGVIPSLRAAWLTELSSAVATNGTMPTNRSAVEALMPWRRYTDARADESPRKPISRLRPPGELGSGGVGAERDHELVGRLRVRGLHVRDELLLLRVGEGRFTRTQTIDLGAIRHEVLALPGEQRRVAGRPVARIDVLRVLQRRGELVEVREPLGGVTIVRVGVRASKHLVADKRIAVELPVRIGVRLRGSEVVRDERHAVDHALVAILHLVVGKRALRRPLVAEHGLPLLLLRRIVVADDLRDGGGRVLWVCAVFVLVVVVVVVVW